MPSIMSDDLNQQKAEDSNENQKPLTALKEFLDKYSVVTLEQKHDYVKVVLTDIIDGSLKDARFLNGVSFALVVKEDGSVNTDNDSEMEDLLAKLNEAITLLADAAWALNDRANACKQQQEAIINLNGKIVE